MKVILNNLMDLVCGIKMYQAHNIEYKHNMSNKNINCSNPKIKKYFFNILNVF